jgi:cellulose biosynthesis protein BcsQ
LFCLIATEEATAKEIKKNMEIIIKKTGAFRDWSFEVCTDGKSLGQWRDRNVEVLVFSRDLKGADPIKLLQQVRTCFTSTHIVLLAGQTTEASKAYMKAAERVGLYNIVTGDLPGDRPYNLVTALTGPRRPAPDGQNEADRGVICSDTPERHSPPLSNILSGLNETSSLLQGQAGSVYIARPEEAYPAQEEDPAQELTPVGETRGVLVVSTANKGGVGKTTAAIATATALSKAGIPTVLVDLDLGAPDLAAFFNIHDLPGIEKLASLNGIDPVQIDRLLVNVRDNLYVMPGPMSKTLPRFTGSELSQALSYLKGKFPVVVCDTCPEPWTKKWLYNTFELADIALAVVDQSKFSEEETKKYAPTIIMMGVKPENIRIVINRFSPKLHPAHKIEASFNSGFKKTCAALPKIGAVIPDNWDASVKETYTGEIALDGASQWHNIAKEIADLAGYGYKPTGSNGPSRDGSSFFARLFKKGDR